MKKKIEIYYYDSLKNILNYKNIDTITTPENQSAIFGINLDPSQNIIAYISKNIGEVIIKVYDEYKKDKEIISKIKKISAHQSEVTYIALNYKGDLLASCSEKGTIIRLNVKDISVLGRSTQGVTLMRTSDGGRVVSIETINPNEDVEELTEE